MATFIDTMMVWWSVAVNYLVRARAWFGDNLKITWTTKMSRSKNSSSTSKPETVTPTGNDDFSWLGLCALGFPIRGRNVKILTEPHEYYSVLKERMSTASRRIELASLYLGVDQLERDLVQTLNNSLARNPNLRCRILLDHLRGTRGQTNSCTLLQPMLAEFRERMSLHLYHTPNFRGLLKSVLPERVNEGMGVQHMKVYIFDDNVLISGANLSHSYFANRQDRYIEFQDCKNLADFLSKLLHVVEKYSFVYQMDGTVSDPPCGQNPLLSGTSSQLFKQKLKKEVEALVHPDDPKEFTIEENAEFDSVVYPLVQMGQVGVTQDEEVTQKLFASYPQGSNTFLASGYFNLPPFYTQTILQGKGKWNIIAASPQANGFYGAKGISGHIPNMYVHFGNKFLTEVYKQQRESDVKYHEYLKYDWTFHGKGLWHYPANEELPTLVLAGSSNFGNRSVFQDLELQVAIVTKNTLLRKSLHEECRNLFKYTSTLNMESTKRPERQLELWERVATAFLSKRV